MKRYKLSVKQLIALFGAITVMLLGNLNYFPVHAATYASNFAWRDDAGNIIFQAVDKKRSSALYYKTIGISISRCDLGTMKRSSNHEYVVFSFNSNKVTVLEEPLDNGMIKTTFIIPEKEFLTRIAAYYSDWLADVQSGDTCYLVIDSVMVCCDSSGPYGYLLDDGTRTGYILKNTYWNVIDMTCTECGGTVPPLKAGWYGTPGDGTPICYGHPCVKDEEDEPLW